MLSQACLMQLKLASVFPSFYTTRYRSLAEEKADSWFSKHFTYWYLEKNGFGRVLQEGDL